MVEWLPHSKNETIKCEVSIIGKQKKYIFSLVHEKQNYVFNLYTMVFVVLWNFP
jgi:hypothetical protein